MDQGRFTRANFAGYDNEAFAIMQPVCEMRHCLAMLGAFVKEKWIGRQLERQLIQTVKFSVHAISKKVSHADFNLISPIRTINRIGFGIDKLIVKRCGESFAYSIG